ncbi:MAG: tetratricopeptide repeat protein [Deltaproteobacteria bacterium]|nr:tetratricopeptide repeat protein [Deltaproteobacteria bacterium]
MSNMNFCSHCGKELSGQYKFCPHCGKRLGSALTLKPRNIFLLAAASLGMFAFSWSLQSKLAGKAPTKEFQQPQENAQHRTEQLSNDPRISDLRRAAKEAPDNLAAWEALAQALAEKIRETQQPAPEIVFETIEVLRHILDRDAKNAFALIAMADLSFEQQAFSKAGQFYQQYLEVMPEDHAARARFASTLSFLNQPEKALAELDLVLKKNPNNFHGKAYSAITYAQMGDYAKARSLGEEALAVAPSDEARERFAEFLSKLDSDQARAKDSTTSSEEAPRLPSDAAAMVETVKKNSVAGPKFKSAKFENGELILELGNFPMSQMPPFVKERFMGSLKEAASKSGGSSTKTVVFVEAENGSELERFSLR